MPDCRYEGCDKPSLEGREYCIRHEPGEKDHVKFYQIIREQMERGDYDFRGYVFPGEADFSKATFEGVAYFQDAKFQGDANFQRAKFHDDARFRVAEFQGDARFEGAEFQRYANFERAEFRGLVYFGVAEFQGSAIFWDAEFQGNAFFGVAEFQDAARFEGAKFRGAALFENVEFQDDAYFVDAEFQGGAYFRVAEFRRVALFGGVQFQAAADFWYTKFWDDASFQGAEFQHTAHFKDVRCEGRLMFGDAKFKRPSDEATACRLAQVTYRRFGDEDTAAEYYLRKKRAETKARRLYDPRKYVGWLLHVLSLYGESPMLVAIWMAVVIFGMAIFYSSTGQILHDVPVGHYFGFRDALYFSVVTFSTLGYGDWYPNPECLTRYVAMGEAIVGAGLMALFIATLVRKWMR